MSADLSVVVTVHDETAVCGPTMRAADLAVEVARRRGLTVQTIVRLDAPTDATLAYFHQRHFDHWEQRVRPDGAPDGVRGAFAAECEGRYLAFLSADDLCSENWLAEGVAAVDAPHERGAQVIAHPELSVVFDGQKAVRISIAQDSPLFTPHHLCFRDYYDSPCIAPREAYLENPDENVEFTIETMAAGWQHIVVKDTIIFERRQDFSAPAESLEPIAGKLSAMAIDRIRDLGSARR